MTQSAGLAARNPQAFGFLVTLLGVTMFFPDALVVRLIAADTMTIAVWRGLAAGAVTLLCLAIFDRASLPGLHTLKSGPSVALMLMQGFGSIFFLASLGQTSAANALLILATAPFLAALLSWVLLKETIDAVTGVAIVAVFAGVAIIGAGSLGGGHLLGDFFAFGNACTIAIYYVVLRMAPQQKLMGSIALGFLLTSVIAFPFAPMLPFTLAQAGLVFLSGGVILAGGVALLQIGPRYLPAPEVSMITMLELVAGPLLVWLFTGENPGQMTLIGGAVILLAITGHSAVRLRQTQSRAAI